MKKIVMSLFILSLGVFLGAGNAFTAIIDFTDSDFGPGMNQPEFTVSVSGVDLTFSAMPTGATLWWDNIDGYGVQSGSYEPDEIEGPEMLNLNFSKPFNLNAIYISDFFNERDYIEEGEYKLDDGTWIPFTADPNQLPSPASNGELAILFGDPVIVSDIMFRAPGLAIDGQNHEFALQGVAGTPVPIPTTILLLGSGLVAMVGIRRRFKY